MNKIVGMGEILIDFTPTGQPWSYKANPGGSVPNFLAQLAVLENDATFVGMVGDDQFGKYLTNTLSDTTVSVDGLKVNKKYPTTLAFVHIDSSGDRSFSFVRNPAADMMFASSDIDYSIIDSCDIFHISGVALTQEPLRTATLTAVKYAKEKGKLITFDPNYRASLWENQSVAVMVMKEALPYIDIIKVSEEESPLLTDVSDYRLAAKALLELGPKLVFLTLGPEGCDYFYKNLTGHVSTLKANIVDTTGSGDAFFGGVISQFIHLNASIENLNEENIKNIALFGNAAGTLCATNFGGIPSVKTRIEIETAIKTLPTLVL